jgi:hypothetical protein
MGQILFEIGIAAQKHEKKYGMKNPCRHMAQSVLVRAIRGSL